MEVDFDRDLNGNGLTVLATGLETPRLDCFDSFFIETHADRVNQPYVSRMTIFPNNQLENYSPLIIRFAGCSLNSGSGA